MLLWDLRGYFAALHQPRTGPGEGLGNRIPLEPAQGSVLLRAVLAAP